jgi:two-component system sensor histidine kinase BaeS
MRRVAILVGFLFLLLLAATMLTAAVATAAFGSSSLGARIAVGGSGAALFVLALLFIGRSVGRMAGPIGEVMEAADRVADGDYTARVSARGPGEVRRLGRAFNEMAERLEASDDQRRRLLADVTHELRTPLAVIHGNMEGILDGVYPPDGEHLTAVLEETRVMARLLDDLQTLSTADAGALRLNPEPTDLGTLADEVVSAFAPRAAAVGVALSASSDNLPQLTVDPLRIRQVLENLVANALRHTPAGGTVTVQLSQQEDAIALAVSDTGPGIPPDQLDSIFDRYTRSADTGGSGLGLAIARSLVEAHGGSIKANNTAGHGAAIHISLPRGN